MLIQRVVLAVLVRRLAGPLDQARSRRISDSIRQRNTCSRTSKAGLFAARRISDESLSPNAQSEQRAILR